MCNLFHSLPIELTREIYDYDPTYKKKLDLSLNLIKHGMEECTCSGDIAAVKTPYFYGKIGNNICLKHDIIGLENPPDDFWHPIWGYYSVDTWYAFMELFNARESFTFNVNGHEIGIEFKYGRTTFPTFWNRHIINAMICSYYTFYISPKSIKIINNKKRLRGRYMDMGHYQRREV